MRCAGPPRSHPTAVNRVIGNLVVEEDPMFGGGFLSVSGVCQTSARTLHVPWFS